MQRSNAGADAANASELAHLHDICEKLQEQLSVVGRMPPRPSTIRGYFGALLVSMVRRSLFWYINQNRQFQKHAVEGFQTSAALINDVEGETHHNRAAVSQLRSEVAELRESIVTLQAAISEQERKIIRLLEAGLRTEHRARVNLEMHVQSELDRVNAGILSSNTTHRL